MFPLTCYFLDCHIASFSQLVGTFFFEDKTDFLKKLYNLDFIPKTAILCAIEWFTPHIPYGEVPIHLDGPGIVDGEILASR